MTDIPVPNTGSTSWSGPGSWPEETETATDQVLYGRLTDTALKATFGDALTPSPGNRPTRLRPTWITTFQSGHGWTNEGFATFAADTTDYALGTQSLKGVTSGAGAYAFMSSPAVSVNLTGRHLVLLLRVENATHLSQLVVYAGNDSGFASQYNWPFIAGTTSSIPNYWSDGEWVLAALPFGEGNMVTTGSPTRTGIVKLQVAAIDDGSGSPVTVHVQAIGTVAESRTTWPNGVVSLTFDDSYAEHFTIARPKLDQYGYAGTLFPIVDLLDTTGRLTTAQVRALRDLGGWEIGGHASTSAAHTTGLPGMTSTQRQAELRAVKAWMRANGSQSDTFAYPQGAYDAGSVTDVRSYFQAARTSFGEETRLATSVPPADPFHILSQNPSGRSLATLTAAVDKAYANGGWYVATFHGITTGGGGSNETATATFNSFIDYLSTKGIPVRTVGEVLRAPAP